MEENSLGKYRVILKREEPSTDIKNIKGVLMFQKNKLVFIPDTPDQELKRSYEMKELIDVKMISKREWLKKTDTILLQFSKKGVSVFVYFEPVDVSSDFLFQEIANFRDQIKKHSFPGVVGSLIEKIGIEGQKIVREMGSIIQSSSQELSHALDKTIIFIREATEAANILESSDFDKKGKTINLNVSDIDEILKRSLASEKIEAMISGLIAKGLISAKDQKFQEALDALRIAREAAENENMKDYTKVADENIKKIETAENVDSLDPQLSEKAIKYANEARDIVAEWEASRTDEEND